MGFIYWAQNESLLRWKKNLSICQTFRKKIQRGKFLKKLWYCIGGGEGKETMVLHRWWKG